MIKRKVTWVDEKGFILPFTLSLYLITFSIVLISIEIYKSETLFFHYAEENYLLDTLITNTVKDVKSLLKDSNPPAIGTFNYDGGYCEYKIKLNEEWSDINVVCQTEHRSRQTVSFTYHRESEEIIDWKE